MAITNYYTINGRLRGEGTVSGGHRSYGPDALGSVTATYDGTGALQNTYRNAPYGTQVQKTGTASNPMFLWNGALGCRATGRTYSGYYVRARHLDNSTGQWTTVDPLWPRELSFVYGKANPVVVTDPTGLNPIINLPFGGSLRFSGCSAGQQQSITKAFGDVCTNRIGSIPISGSGPVSFSSVYYHRPLCA